MQLLNIKACDLEQFVNSDLFQKLSSFPITRHRAYSQANNPRAKADDIVLIIAYSDEFELLGYIGSLPDDIQLGEQQFHIAWNSCWWSHPEKGKPASMKIFAEMFKAWDYRVCFSDLNEKGKNFVELTGKYTLIPYTGYKFIFRVYLAKYITNKIKYLNNPVTKIVLGFIDFWLNSVLSLVQYTKLPMDGERAVPEICETLPDDAIAFIQSAAHSNISGRNKPEFDWIVQNPWILTDKTTRKKYSGNYFFSHSAKTFKQYFLVVREKKHITGILFLQNRDGHFRVPYAFFANENLKHIGQALLQYVLHRRADSLTIYHPKLSNFIADANSDLTKKQLTRYAAFPKSMGELPENMYIQDGDGDAVFC